jgi:hypothetical protein
MSRFSDMGYGRLNLEQTQIPCGNANQKSNNNYAVRQVSLVSNPCLRSETWGTRS